MQQFRNYSSCPLAVAPFAVVMFAIGNSFHCGTSNNSKDKCISTQQLRPAQLAL